MLPINKNFVSQIKYLKLKHIQILVYLYSWILSNNPPKLRQFEPDGLFYFYIYLDKIASDLFLTRRQVQNALFRLENKDLKIKSSLQPFIFPKQVKKENRLYIALNPEMIPFIVSDNVMAREVQKRLNGNPYNVTKIVHKESVLRSYNNPEEKKMLFELDEKKPKYGIEAYSIVKKLIEKSKKENNEYFRHKYNEYGEEQTKLMTKACQFVQAIYNGNFLNPRRFALSEKFLNNQQFPIEISKVKEILNEVKGDWMKVRKLILSAYENFDLMHDENYCPCNKDYLTKNISDWFYGYSDEAGKYQSQFIQCLFEVPLTKKFYSEKKADDIFEKLDGKSQDYGEELIDLNPKMNSGTAWENIEKIVEWAKLVLTVEPNAKYWIETPSDIIRKFVSWAKNNNIQINVNSFNIERCVENNGPWVWFVQKAIQEYKLNYQLSSLVDEADFLDCYNFEIGF